MADVDEMKEKARSSMVSVRLGAEEQEKVRRMAAEKGASVSQFIRDAVLEQCRISVPVDFHSYPSSASVSSSGLILESHDGHLVPRTPLNTPYVHVP